MELSQPQAVELLACVLVVIWVIRTECVAARSWSLQYKLVTEDRLSTVKRATRLSGDFACRGPLCPLFENGVGVVVSSICACSLVRESATQEVSLALTMMEMHMAWVRHCSRHHPWYWRCHRLALWLGFFYLASLLYAYWLSGPSVLLSPMHVSLMLRWPWPIVAAMLVVYITSNQCYILWYIIHERGLPRIPACALRVLFAILTLHAIVAYGSNHNPSAVVLLYWFWMSGFAVVCLGLLKFDVPPGPCRDPVLPAAPVWWW